MMIRTLALAILFWGALDCCAQNSQRYELDLGDGRAVLSTTVLNGAVAVESVANFKKSQHTPNRIYTVLDTGLNVLSEHESEVNFRHKYVGSSKTSNTLYQFFYDYRFGDYTLVWVDRSGNMGLRVGKLPARIFDPDFVIGDGMIYVVDNNPRKHRLVWQELGDHDAVRYVEEFKPVVRRGLRKTLCLNYDENSTYVTYVWSETRRKKTETRFAIIGVEGGWNGVGKLELEGKEVKNISVNHVNDGDDAYLAGTYGEASVKGSSGVFLAHVQDGSVMELKKTPLTNLTHFFDYMSDREKEDFKRLMDRRKRHERSTDVSHLMIQGGLLHADSSFVLPIEVYTENYTDTYGITRGGNSIAGMPGKVTGYNFSHASIVRFNYDGSVIHDDYVPIELEYIPEQLQTNLKVSKQKGKGVSIGYASRHYIYHGLLQPRSLLSVQKDTAMWPERNGVSEQDVRMSFWSEGQDVLLYGFETRKREAILQEKRNIYFMEKGNLR